MPQQKAARCSTFLRTANPADTTPCRGSSAPFPPLMSYTNTQSDATSSAPIVAWHGKLSILDTKITSWDAAAGGPDERVLEDGRAYIAALSGENAESGKVYTSRMDVEDSEISYLGNEGDYHNDIGAFDRSFAGCCCCCCCDACLPAYLFIFYLKLHAFSESSPGGTDL